MTVVVKTTSVLGQNYGMLLVELVNALLTDLRLVINVMGTSSQQRSLSNCTCSVQKGFIPL